MSKFKVGDKVIVWGEVVRTIARIDKWLNGEYVYYFNMDELLSYYKEDDLELYKTPRERLLELGWVALNETGKTLTYILYGSLHAERIELSPEEESFYTTLRFIDLQLAEILVDYLKELSNEKSY